MSEVTSGSRNPSMLDGVVFIISMSLIAHFLFSWMGLIPTDDGFVMAYSRRLLEGEVPHRDFISIRPLGSPLLYMPCVLLGGEHTFYVSRFLVWVEFAFCAWLWTRIIETLLASSLRRLDRFLLAMIAFSFTAHTFPLMAWFTVDGLFLLSLGVYLAVKESGGVQIVGYVLMGAAALCKQTFVFAGPVAAAILGHWRRLPVWIGLGLPAAAYGAWLLWLGVAGDAMAQMTVHRDLISKGIYAYAARPSMAWGILAGYLLWSRLADTGHARTGLSLVSARLAAMLGVTGILGSVAASSLLMSRGLYVGLPSFGVFGVATGMLLDSLGRESWRRRIARAGGLALVSAWCASISDGYNTPALGTGPLFVLLLAGLMEEMRFQPAGGQERSAMRERIVTLLLLFAAIVAALGFATGRREQVYLERPASELVWPLGKVFPGAAGIWGSRGTYEFLADLGEARILAQRHAVRYAIVPDLAGYWVKSEEVNPLIVDWSNRTELGSAALEERALRDLASQRGKVAVITQKVEAASVARGPVPPQGRRVLLDYVREHFRKVGETRFFEVYW